jgi:DNA-binding response OmpR family regulator
MLALGKDCTMGQRLLVLDADGMFINEHRAALEFNFEVDFVDCPDNVIDMLESGNYAAGLISAELGDSSGYTVCASIRNKLSLRGFKLVLISSKATKADFARHKRTRGRADLYLHKPIATSKLVSSLGNFIPPKTFALDSTLDVLMGVDIGEDWLKSLNSVEPTKESNLQASAAELLNAQQENQELQSQNTGLQASVSELEAELQAKMAELLNAQQENQELQNQNATITANFEERQKKLEDVQRGLKEAETQLKCLESPQALEKHVYRVLYNRMNEAVSEKKSLLEQLEALTEELAAKNQEAISLIRAREESQQHLLAVEEGMRRLEQEFEDRVECERKLIFTSMEDLKYSEAAAHKRVRELEESCAAGVSEIESLRVAHEEEKQRLIEDFEMQKQNLISSFKAQKEEKGGS